MGGRLGGDNTRVWAGAWTGAHAHERMSMPPCQQAHANMRWVVRDCKRGLHPVLEGKLPEVSRQKPFRFTKRFLAALRSFVVLAPAPTGPGRDAGKTQIRQRDQRSCRPSRRRGRDRHQSHPSGPAPRRASRRRPWPLSSALSPSVPSPRKGKDRARRVERRCGRGEGSGTHAYAPNGAARGERGQRRGADARRSGAQKTRPRGRRRRSRRGGAARQRRAHGEIEGAKGCHENASDAVGRE